MATGIKDKVANSSIPAATALRLDDIPVSRMDAWPTKSTIDKALQLSTSSGRENAPQIMRQPPIDGLSSCRSPARPYQGVAAISILGLY